MRNSGFIAAAASLAASAALLAGPSASFASRSIQQCALGTEVPEIKGVYAEEIAEAEARYVRGLEDLGPHARARAGRVFAAGVAAYVYGLPQVTARATVEKFLHNQILSVAQLADPSFKSVVTPNNDTAYTLAWLDLLTGPLVIDVPDTNDRYYVLQLLDAYTNSFAYIGRRATGTKAASYALVPPGWKGALPAAVKRVDSPTNTVVLAGRTVVNGVADMPAVKETISQYRVTPLGEWSAGQRRPPVVLDQFPPTFTPTVIPTGPAFVDALNRSLRIDPPPAADACALAAMAPAGVRARRTSTVEGAAGEAADIPSSPPSSPSGERVRRTLETATRAGHRLLDGAMARFNAASRQTSQGWQSTTASWLAAYGRNYLARAMVTQLGFGANGPAEAVYPIATTDPKGRELNGAHEYVIRFPKGELPPVDAFWSLTMYGADRFMYENEIERYSIGDRTPGLRYGRDGSLSLYVQHARPTARRELANWLPAPAGAFRLVLRLYQPRRAVVTGAWKPAWVKRAPRGATGGHHVTSARG